MTEKHPGEALEVFAANVMRTLEKSGYPAKRVALPLERMYEVAHKKGLNFNRALEVLAAKGVAHEKTDLKLIFFPQDTLPKLDPVELMAQAQAMMKDLTPEQLKAIKDMYDSMPEEQRQEIMKGIGQLR